MKNYQGSYWKLEKYNPIIKLEYKIEHKRLPFAAEDPILSLEEKIVLNPRKIPRGYAPKRSQ